MTDDELHILVQRLRAHATSPVVLTSKLKADSNAIAKKTKSAKMRALLDSI